MAKLRKLAEIGHYIQTLDNIPQVHESEVFYWDAFDILNTDRQYGMAVGYIPFTAIDAYAKRYGIEGDDFDAFFYIITQLDRVYVKHANKKDNK